MTMPSKIWAGQYPTNQNAGDWDVVKEFPSDTLYIRADIAEELAQALEEFGEYESWMAARWRAALDRYRALAD